MFFECIPKIMKKLHAFNPQSFFAQKCTEKLFNVRQNKSIEANQKLQYFISSLQFLFRKGFEKVSSSNIFLLKTENKIIFFENTT